VDFGTVAILVQACSLVQCNNNRSIDLERVTTSMLVCSEKRGSFPFIVQGLNLTKETHIQGTCISGSCLPLGGACWWPLVAWLLCCSP
jgi:hypothetical protein